MQITDYAPPANSQAFIKYPELEPGSRSSQRLSYLSCAPGSDGILGTFPHSVLVICKGPMLQGHDNVSPAFAKSVVKWLLLQTEGSKRAGDMQAHLPAVVGTIRSAWQSDSSVSSPLAHWSAEPSVDFTSIQGYILLALSHTQFNLHLLWTIGLRQEA